MNDKYIETILQTVCNECGEIDPTCKKCKKSLTDIDKIYCAGESNHLCEYHFLMED